MTRHSPMRTVLIGLDGATFAVLDALMADGTMPFLCDFAARGVRAPLRSTPLPLTPIAWTSLMTGLGPGRHGIFDFVRVTRSTQSESSRSPLAYRTLSAADVSGETVWSTASRRGCRVTALNFPCTYLHPEIDGAMISGHTPSDMIRRAVRPRSLYDRLAALPGFDPGELLVRLDIERKAVQGLAPEELAGWIERYSAQDRQWFQVLKYLMDCEPCELTAVLFDGVDRIQHLCWALIDPRSTTRASTAVEDHVRSLCRAYFAQLDGMLCETVRLAGEDARVFVVSDHGARAAGNELFYVNTWLHEEGYLEWADGVPVDETTSVGPEDSRETIEMFDWSRTRAAAITSAGNGIYIHQAEDAHAPGVSPAEYAAFRAELKAKLEGYRHPRTSEPVVARAMTRDEIYHGTRACEAPDLTLELGDQSFVALLRTDSPLKRRRWSWGTHDPFGIFLAAGPGIRADADVAPFSIVDVGPTLLYSLGLPVPHGLDGQPALAPFESAFVDRHPVRTELPRSADDEANRSAPSLDPLEADQLLRVHRLLGY